MEGDWKGGRGRKVTSRAFTKSIDVLFGSRSRVFGRSRRFAVEFRPFPPCSGHIGGNPSPVPFGGGESLPAHGYRGRGGALGDVPCGVSVCRVGDVPQALWSTWVSASTVRDFNQTAFTGRGSSGAGLDEQQAHDRIPRSEGAFLTVDAVIAGEFENEVRAMS